MLVQILPAGETAEQTKLFDGQAVIHFVVHEPYQVAHAQRRHHVGVGAAQAVADGRRDVSVVRLQGCGQFGRAIFWVARSLCGRDAFHNLKKDEGFALRPDALPIIFLPHGVGRRLLAVVCVHAAKVSNKFGQRGKMAHSLRFYAHRTCAYTLGGTRVPPWRHSNAPAGILQCPLGVLRCPLGGSAYSQGVFEEKAASACRYAADSH